MPIFYSGDAAGYNEWQTIQEKALFQNYRRKQAAGVEGEELDAWFDAELDNLMVEDEKYRRSYEIDIPWWEQIYRWIRLQFLKLYYSISGVLGFRDESPVTRYVTNPVGDIPVLGQLVGFGFEIGRTIQGDKDVEIVNQYGSIPILSDVGKLSGTLVKYWPITLIAVGGIGILYLFGQFAPLLAFIPKRRKTDA